MWSFSKRVVLLALAALVLATAPSVQAAADPKDCEGAWLLFWAL